jgi:hypothetical protein
VSKIREALQFAFWLALLASEGWAVMAGMVSLLTAVVALNASPVWLVVWLGNTLVFVWKHRHELAHLPELRIIQRKTRS